jgi:hypothetical protein
LLPQPPLSIGSGGHGLVGGGGGLAAMLQELSKKPKLRSASEQRPLRLRPRTPPKKQELPSANAEALGEHPMLHLSPLPTANGEEPVTPTTPGTRAKALSTMKLYLAENAKLKARLHAAEAAAKEAKEENRLLREQIAPSVEQSALDRKCFKEYELACQVRSPVIASPFPQLHL